MYTIPSSVPVLARLRTSRPSPRSLAICSLLVGATFFGFGTVATKGALDGFPPLTLAGARFGIAAVVLTVLCRVMGVKPVYDHRALLLGVTGVALPFAFQNFGLQRASAGSSTLLIEGGVPLMTAALGVAILRERIGGSRLAGILLGVGGVGVVALHEVGGGMPLSGSVLALSAAAALALYTVLGRKIYRDGFSLAVLTGGTTVGTLILAPLVSTELVIGGVPSPDRGDVLLVLFLGLVCSAATQLLWAHGMTHLDAAEIGIFGTFMPVVGIAAAAMFLGEAITVVQLIGAAMIAAGMVTTARETPVGSVRRVARPRHPASAGVVTAGLIASAGLMVSIAWSTFLR